MAGKRVSRFCTLLRNPSRTPHLSARMMRAHSPGDTQDPHLSARTLAVR